MFGKHLITRPNCILWTINGFSIKDSPFILLLLFQFFWSFRQNFNMFKGRRDNSAWDNTASFTKCLIPKKSHPLLASSQHVGATEAVTNIGWIISGWIGWNVSGWFVCILLAELSEFQIGWIVFGWIVFGWIVWTRSKDILWNPGTYRHKILRS